ncbi:MAG: hypothetical protein NTY10_04580 [Candidatus Omnitrophica bacterium]|nr:hypothetical protein [Candidatus Omnitrophota bacterium]
MNSITIKTDKLFSRGKAVIIACDHGEFDGPISGMVDFSETVSKINKEVDGVLMSPGMVRHTGNYFTAKGAPLVIGRLNWNTVYCFHWNYKEAVSVESFSPEEAAFSGVEMALVSLTLKTGDEKRDAQNVGIFRKAIAECHRIGLPVIGEYFPADSDNLSPEDMHQQVKLGCRISAELGADMIKTFYTHKFSEVVAGCPVPIFALGAAKLPTQLEALELARQEISEGAQGVVFGRNALQVKNPSAFQSALCAVVKNGISPKKALQKYGLKD